MSTKAGHSEFYKNVHKVNILLCDVAEFYSDAWLECGVMLNYIQVYSK